jgi:PAS domain S-box-containing protein
VLGVVFRRHFRGDFTQYTTPPLLILGLLIAIQRLVWTLLLTGDQSQAMFNATAFPVLIVYPIGVAIVGGLLRWREQSLLNARKLHEQEAHFRLTTMHEISERRQAEAQLARERDMLRTLIDHLPDYIFIKDTEGRFVVSNKAHAHAVQVEPEALVGKTAYDFFPEQFAAQYHTDDQLIMQSQVPLINVERETLKSDGSKQMVLTTKVPLYERDGQCIGLVGISRDITARKAAEEKSLRYAIEHERLKALHRFIRDVSHDLRTPLSVINTSTYFLQRQGTAEQQPRLQIINAQVEHLTRILDSMHRASRLDTETALFNFQVVDVNAVIELVIKEHQAAALEKQQVLLYKSLGMAIQVNADELALRQSIEHLVRNAITYTPEQGKIVVEAQLDRGTAANGVTIVIQDSGVGISQNDQTLIFEHFYRVNEARTFSQGSAGLGLPIARKIIEAHGGQITVESELGAGSTFRIMLPTVPPTSEASAQTVSLEASSYEPR